MNETLIWPGQHTAPAGAVGQRGTAWTTMAACLLERPQLLMKGSPQWEQDYQSYQNLNEELLHSRELYANREAQHLNKLAHFSGGAKTTTVDDMDDAQSVTLRTLPADESGDRRTSARALTERLYLLVKARDALEPKRLVWQFPTVRYAMHRKKATEAEKTRPLSMRQTVESGLRTYFGKEVDSYPVGFSPIGHLCFELPPHQQDEHDSYGKTLFFYRAQYLGGDIVLNRKRIADFAWVTREEVGDYFPAPAARRIKAMLS